MIDSERAYINGSFFDKFEPKHSFNIIKQDGINETMCNNFVDTLSGVVKFWSHDYEYEAPIAVISCDELGYDWLYEQLKSFNFQDAMPSK
jgi:hypothetical protein